MRPLYSLALVSVVVAAVLAGCDEPTREPPKITPSSGTGVGATTTTGSGMGGAGGMASSSSTTTTAGSGSTSTATTSTSGSSSSSMCVPATCNPECSGFKDCIEVTPCDFQCSDGAVGDPCATTNDCVATLTCLNHICE